MNSIRNKIVLITGSTDGIGKQTALDLAKMGAELIVHGRNEERALNAIHELKATSGNEKMHFVTSDLSSLKQIKNMSDEIHHRFEKIDVLINNAGVFKTKRELSDYGFEMTFAVNHLSYFLLTKLLLDLIGESEYKRIVNVASQAHADKLDFDNLQGERHFDGFDAYSRSKLCNIMFTYALAQRLDGTGIIVNALHPGVISTKLLHTGFGMGGSSLNTGSKTSVFLTTSPEVDGVSGGYFVNSRLAKSSKISYDQKIQDELWSISEKLVS
ncbi:MAG: SDR family oxidoreductase [Bacteroidales bacterium]